MPNSVTLADIDALAEFAHRGQVDKAGNPYINHPRRVLASVQAQGAQPYVQFAALLHDVTEDTPFTLEMLEAFSVPAATLEIVRLMDRKLSKLQYHSVGQVQNGPEDTWPEWAQFVAHHSASEFYYAELRKNPAAVIVKLADIGDNTQPWRLSYLPQNDQARLIKKYADATQALTA